MIYPWQQTQWQQQIDAVKQNKLAHALMLVGPKGVGKNHFARNLAQRVLCGIAGEKPCGSCRDCELFAVGNHPDFINLELLENSKSIKIDQVRELTRALNQTSQRGGYQVAIIHAADTLNQASANALLKTLEEPPGEVLIILLVEQTGRLPATIHSRCQRMNFSAENNLAVQSWLRQKLPHEQDLELLLKLANNAPLQAIALSEADIFKVRTLVLSQLQALVESKIDPVGAAEVLLKAELSLW
nr:DNA polymerase III subunit delta' [Gammaproteobacteria bacterium]